MQWNRLLVLGGALIGIGLAASTAQAQVDIAFDDFCDGMHFEYGADLLTGGNRTGCGIEPLIGNVTANFGSTPFPAFGLGQNVYVDIGNFAIFIINFQSQVWCNYVSVPTGAIPTLLNCGTFTYGTPNEATANAPSSLD